MRTVNLTVQVTMNIETDPDAVAEKLFNFLASDPDDLFPEIITVDGHEASPT